MFQPHRLRPDAAPERCDVAAPRSCPPACAGRALRALAVLALLASLEARAQTSFAATLVSEYSLRGLSLSDGRAVPQLRVEHDTQHGWYGGVFGSRVVMGASRADAAVTGYGGHARRLASGLGWDFGLTRTVFPRDARYNYTEAYAGISSEHASLRLFFSPEYYRGGRTAYLELSAVQPLGERLRLTGRAGVTRRLESGASGERYSIDLRVALAADIGDASVELGLQARERDPGLRAPRARALFASASIGF